MYSQTSIGRDIFAVVWGLGVLAAAAAAEAVQIPFDTQLRDFVAEQRADFDATWSAIQEAACLDDDVMLIPEEDAPWSGRPKSPLDIVSLKIYLVCADPNPYSYRGTDKFERLTFDRDHIQEAVGHLLGALVGELLTGRWAFCERAREGAETPLQLRDKVLSVFRAINPMLLKSRLRTAEPDALLSAAWAEWRQTKGDALIVAPDADPGFREWLKRQVNGMPIQSGAPIRSESRTAPRLVT